AEEVRRRREVPMDDRTPGCPDPLKSRPHILILAPAEITPPTCRRPAGMVETATPDPRQFLDLPRGRLARASLARLHGRATGSELRREGPCVDTWNDRIHPHSSDRCMPPHACLTPTRCRVRPPRLLSPSPASTTCAAGCPAARRASRRMCSPSSCPRVTARHSRSSRTGAAWRPYL